MTRLTLGDAKTALAGVAGRAGFAVDDPRLVNVICYVTQVLLPELNHPMFLERVRFCNYGGCIALPLEYETALKFTIQSSNVPIGSRWYEFVGYGPGRQDTTYGSVGIPIDRGESPLLRQADTDDDDGGQYLRVYSFVDERVDGEIPTVRVLAKDTSGRLIRTADSDGVYTDGVELALNGHLASPATTTSIKLSEVLGIIKPRTNKDIEFSWVDSDGDEHFAARYRWKDTNPMFRLYYCPGVVEDDEYMSVHALCRRRYSPAVDDSDLLLVSNLRALRLGIIAASLEEAQDDRAKAYWADAVASLRAEAEAWYGDQIPQIDVPPETGFGEQLPVW